MDCLRNSLFNLRLYSIALKTFQPSVEAFKIIINFLQPPSEAFRSYGLRKSAFVVIVIV